VTCHNGVYKPLYGFQMAKHYPAVWGTHTDWTTPLPPAFTTPPAPPVIDTAAVVADSLATPMASPASPVVPPTGR